MSALTNEIECFLKKLLNDADNGTLEIQRNNLAKQFGCAPSQINYVLTTRFAPYKGYLIESRRGGGGCIKIMKLQIPEDESFNDLLTKTIGESITIEKCRRIIESLIEQDLITDKEARLISGAVSDMALSSHPNDSKNYLRADILKSLLFIVAE